VVELPVAAAPVGTPGESGQPPLAAALRWLVRSLTLRQGAR